MFVDLVRESEEERRGGSGGINIGGRRVYTERLLRGTDVRTWQVQLLFGVGVYLLTFWLINYNLLPFIINHKQNTYVLLEWK